jgi:hypothetical protein
VNDIETGEFELARCGDLARARGASGGESVWNWTFGVTVMLMGRIDERFEATLRLVAGNFVGEKEWRSLVVDAIVDTG